MSTKATFKRVALVAVASLGFGVLSSIAPATAAGEGGETTDTQITAVAIPRYLIMRLMMLVCC